MTTVPSIQGSSIQSRRACAEDIRPLVLEDIPEVASLYMRAYRQCSSPASADLCDYFTRVFLSDPWRALDASPSLVGEDDRGRLLGFIGAHPRRFEVNGRAITAVVMGQMMVAPEAQRRGIARRLGQTLIDGPQALTIGTTASASAARLWRSLGFWNPSASGMTWRIPMSDARTGFLGFWQRRSRRDLGAGRGFRVRPIRGGEEWCEISNGLNAERAVRPRLDLAHATWHWALSGESTAKGRREGWVVEDAVGGTVGWVVGLVDSSSGYRVLEWVCEENGDTDMVRAVVSHGRAQGWKRIRGVCTSPKLTAAVVECGAKLHAGPAAHVYFSNDPEVRAAIVNGDHFVSELQSESWLDFASRA